MLERAKPKIPSHPVGVNIFRALVDGERNRSDKSDTGEGSGDTYVFAKARVSGVTMKIPETSIAFEDAFEDVPRKKPRIPSEL